MKAFDGLGPTRFHLHRASQSLAYFIGIVGFSTGLFMGNHYRFRYVPRTDRCIGITLMRLASTQVCIVIFLRPKKDNKHRILSLYIRLWNYCPCHIKRLKRL